MFYSLNPKDINESYSLIDTQQIDTITRQSFL